MISLQIKSSKALMSRLLAGDAFDSFLLQEAALSTAVTYSIDGRINRDFYPVAELEAGQHPYEFQPWSEFRDIAYQLIRGKLTPTFFRFVLQLKPESAEALLKKEYPDGDFSAVRGLVINLKFDGTNTTLTTGTSYTTFIQDKTADQIWDRALMKFLGLKGIEFELQ